MISPLLPPELRVRGRNALQIPTLRRAPSKVKALLASQHLFQPLRPDIEAWFQQILQADQSADPSTELRNLLASTDLSTTDRAHKPGATPQQQSYYPPSPLSQPQTMTTMSRESSPTPTPAKATTSTLPQDPSDPPRAPFPIIVGDLAQIRLESSIPRTSDPLDPTSPSPYHLIHGFPWPRAILRIHVIVNNLGDASPDYTMSTSCNSVMTSSLRKLFPSQCEKLPNLTMVEEYDPRFYEFKNEIEGYGHGEGAELNEGWTEEYAWVADTVIRLVFDEAKGIAGLLPKREKGKDAPCEKIEKYIDGVGEEVVKKMGEIRDGLGIDGFREQVGWYLVYNSDPLREEESSDEEEDNEEEEEDAYEGDEKKEVGGEHDG